MLLLPLVKPLMYANGLRRNIKYAMKRLRGVWEQYIRYNPAMLTLVIFAVIFTTVLIPIMWAFKFINITTLISTTLTLIVSFASLVYYAIRHYSSTSPLRLFQGDDRNHSGLDIIPLGNIVGNYNGFRVVAVISNDGNAEIEKAWANITVKVRCLKRNNERKEVGKWSQDLKSILLHNVARRMGKQYTQLLNNPRCTSSSVNENNPFIIKEPLPWSKLIRSKNKSRIMHEQETSIPPGQRSELILFDFIRIGKLRYKYLVAILSEYGDNAPYRACLLLDNNHELLLEVTVHGKGARAPLKFKLCITTDKLDNFVKKMKKKYSQKATYQLLNNLKCDAI